jgi:hypothetical protein
MWEEASDGFSYSDLGPGVEFTMDNNNVESQMGQAHSGRRTNNQTKPNNRQTIF